MKRQTNIFIIKLRKKIEMYSAFLIYIVGGTFFDSIDGIVVFKNSKDIYPCYFFDYATPLSNEVKEAKTEGFDTPEFLLRLLEQIREAKAKQYFIF